MASGIGIVGYGSYIPRYRISVEEIAHVWHEDGKAISKGIAVAEKSVPGLDEDVITISTEAARDSVLRAEINPSEIGALYVGSESHPYAVKPSAVTVAEAIGSVPHCTCADLEFACKAGTAGIQMVLGMVASGQIKYGLAIGSDTAQGRPGDALEYTAAAGGAAFIIGSGDIRNPGPIVAPPLEPLPPPPPPPPEGPGTGASSSASEGVSTVSSTFAVVPAPVKGNIISCIFSVINKKLIVLTDTKIKSDITNTRFDSFILPLFYFISIFVVI